MRAMSLACEWQALISGAFQINRGNRRWVRWALVRLMM